MWALLGLVQPIFELGPLKPILRGGLLTLLFPLTVFDVGPSELGPTHFKLGPFKPIIEGGFLDFHFHANLCWIFGGRDDCLKMQARLMVGPSSVNGGGFISSASASAAAAKGMIPLVDPQAWSHGHDRRAKFRCRAAINGDQDHYAVLGLSRAASSADVKKAYRLLARKVVFYIFVFLFGR